MNIKNLRALKQTVEIPAFVNRDVKIHDKDILTVQFRDC